MILCKACQQIFWKFFISDSRDAQIPMDGPDSPAGPQLWSSNTLAEVIYFLASSFRLISSSFSAAMGWAWREREKERERERFATHYSPPITFLMQPCKHRISCSYITWVRQQAPGYHARMYRGLLTRVSRVLQYRCAADEGCKR